MLPHLFFGIGASLIFGQIWIGFIAENTKKWALRIVNYWAAVGECSLHPYFSPL